MSYEQIPMKEWIPGEGEIEIHEENQTVEMVEDAISQSGISA